MPRKYAPQWIAPGIVRDGDWLIATVRHGGSRDGKQVRPRQKFRIGDDYDAALRAAIAWQLETKAALIRERPAIGRGTLAADVATFLKTLDDERDGKRYHADSVELMAHWCRSPLGAMPRHAITRVDVLTQRADWQKAGHAASSINRRVGRLRRLYIALDGDDAPNPTDKIKGLAEPERGPRDIPPRIVRLILDSCSDRGRPERGQPRSAISITKLRLRVMAWSGQPPETIAKITRRDLRLTSAPPQIRLPRRMKGGGVSWAWVEMIPDAAAAWRDFVAAELLGKRWGGSSVGKTWRLGITRAVATATRHAATGDATWREIVDELAALPPSCRPYDLRHSFASEMYRITGDIRVVAELLQHSPKSLSTTARYTKGAVSTRVAAAITKATDTYAASAVPPPPPAPPALRVVGGRG